jgi:ASC-1-like (ASCH) protein
MIHELKTWTKYFEAIKSGHKTFEIRINDRDFKPGDTLYLQEYDPEINFYTGRTIIKVVGYVMESTSNHNHMDGIQNGYIIMSLLEPNLLG